MRFRTFNALWKNLIFMARNGASLGVLMRHVKSASEEDKIGLQSGEAVEAYQRVVHGKQFSQDWFTGNIPHWINAFRIAEISANSSVKVLEIGSFEGRSALFFLDYFRSGTIHCVDTWVGSDEHDCLSEVGELLSRFRDNTSSFRTRLKMFEMTSNEYFVSSDERNYDVVYVDGSHRASDVLTDAVSGFSRLRPGGLLILDDYLWKHYDRLEKNPCSAINAFMNVFEEQFDYVRVGYQVYLRKL